MKDKQLEAVDEDKPPSQDNLYRHAGRFPTVNHVLSALSGLWKTLDSSDSVYGLRIISFHRRYFSDSDIREITCESGNSSAKQRKISSYNIS